MTHPEDQTAAEAKRAPRILAATLASIALLAVLTWGARVLWFSPETPSTGVSPSSTAPAPSGPAPAGTSGDDGCALDSDGSDISSTPPEAERWLLVADVRVPEVSGAGPCRTFDAIDVGFAHSMTGAVVAAYNYVAVGGGRTSEEQIRSFLNYAVLEGPIQDALIERVEGVLSGAIPEAAGKAQEFDVRGYEVVSYTDETAYVSLLATHVQSYRSVSITVKLVWVDDDWRVDPAGVSNWASTVVDPLEAPFTLWGSGEQ